MHSSPKIRLSLASTLVLGLVPCAHAALTGEQSLLTQYAPSSMKLGGAVADLVTGDIDHDGDVDVLSADSTTSFVHVLVNTGGGFVHKSINVGAGPSALALGDVDGDGDLDLLVGLGGAMRLFGNDGAGNFTLRQSVSFPAGDSGSVGAHLKDANHDGALDAVIGLSHHSIGPSYSGALFIALGDGAGAFTALPAHVLAYPAFALVTGDFDGDGNLDAAELGGFGVSASTVSLAFGNGDGTFVNGATTYAAGAYAGALTTGDFDGDGAPELVAGGKYNLSVYHNDGVGHFALLQNVSMGAYAKGATVGDIDGDGDLDLMASSGSASAMRMLANDGAGHFTLSATIGATVQCYAVVLADTNGDGFLDPWGGDVVNGTLTHGDSHSIVARYGASKLNSLGCAPAMTASGSPSISGPGITIGVAHEITQQPGVFLLGIAPMEQATLGGQLLVATPWILVPMTTGVGSGNPSVCDGTATLTLTSPALALGGAGLKVYAQALTLDSQQSDATDASLSDGLWFEIVP